jgi:hypothetical protein
MMRLDVPQMRLCLNVFKYLIMLESVFEGLSTLMDHTRLETMQ